MAAVGTDVFLLEVIGAAGGEYVETVMAFSSGLLNSATPDTDATQLVNDFIAAVKPVWLPCMANDYTLAGYHARRVSATGGPDAAIVDGGIGTRPKGAQVQSSGALIIANWYDPTHVNKAPKPPGKWSATRIFVPSAAQGDIVDGQVQAGYGVALSALTATLAAPFGAGPAGPWNYCVWSRKQKVGYTVGSPFVSLITGTQRRRLHPVI
jgi:hypothetical protein